MNIAITGAGIVSAIGRNKAEALSSLVEGRSGICEMKVLRSVHRELPVGEVKMSNDEMKEALGLPSDKIISRTTLMGMLAVREAITEAGLGSGERQLLISGTTVGGMDVSEELYPRLKGGIETLGASEKEALRRHDGGSSTEDIAACFKGVFDGWTTVSTACSSAANAIMLGARLIKAGKADVVVAGGAEALTRFHLGGFNSLMILDHEPCKPFDAKRQGLNLGEGAGYIVLESGDHAQKRGAKPIGWLTGYGNACDAFHQTATSENGEGPFLAMQEALRTAGLQAKDISYVNAHGTGTGNNDSSESAALRRVFGEGLPPVSSTKAFTGHATSAAGGIEAVICLLAMQEQFIPANLGFSAPSEGCILPSTGATGQELRHIMSNSFGFGGNDSCLIFSSEPTCGDDALPDMPVKTYPAVTLRTKDDLNGLRNYLSPMEARRMGKLLKAAYLSSLKALKEAGLEKPDAVISATRYGCLENSEKILEQLGQDEQGCSPTLFMQSTHNTLATEIARRLSCHGYNITYTQGDQSLQSAMQDAALLISSGKCRSVLVGVHDENAPTFGAAFGEEFEPDYVYSHSLVLTCGE